MTASSLRAGTMAETRHETVWAEVMESWKRPDFPLGILYVIIAVYEYPSPEIVCVGQHGVCLLCAGVFHPAPLPARRIFRRRQPSRRLCPGIERKTGASVGLA